MSTYVMKTLQNKNIKITIVNQQTKNHILNQLQQEKIKILKQNYFVKL